MPWWPTSAILDLSFVPSRRSGFKTPSFVAGVLYNTTLTDIETGYKMIRTPLLKEINIKSNGFGFEPEITAKIIKKKARIYEIPISYYGRTYNEGKKIFWYHGVEALWALFKYRFMD